MDKELQRYYEERFNMMSTDAWSDLMQDVQNMLEATDKASVIKSNDDLWFRKGEISIMQWLLNLKGASEEAYKGLQEEN